MTTTIEQLDLAEHVFRSVRGWLHQLFPDDLILIERRTDTSLTEDDAEDGIETPQRHVWNLTTIAGPTWDEHTGGSSMWTMRLGATRQVADVMEAHRTVGRAVANATRPGGLIQLYGYNLVYPQAPNLYAGSGSTSWTSERTDVAVAPATADGTPLTRPCAPVTVSTPDGTTVAVEPLAWPYGGLGERWAVYAAPEGEALARQGTIWPGDTYVLTADADGPSVPTGLRVPLRGLRVNSAEGSPRQLKTDDVDTWEAEVVLGLTVQVPRVLAAHLAPVLVP